MNVWLVSFTLGGLLILTASTFGCTTGTVAGPSPSANPIEPGPSEGAEDEAEMEADAAARDADVCAVKIPKKSGCGNNGSWVRGVARFDPSHLAGGARPVLRVLLRHEFMLIDGEDAIGGRLHGWKSVPIEDPSTGEVPFAIDMCAGAPMWSEENGAFHLVTILDEDGNNDLDDAESVPDSFVRATPGATELVKLTRIEVSCNAPSPCIDVDLDCTGPSCTKVEPIESCKRKTPSCGNSGFCD